MRYVAAYMLATLGSNQNPSAGDLEKIINSVGVEADTEKLKKVIGELQGKSVDELIAQGLSKLATMPSGGGVAAPAAGGAAPASGAPEKKAEKKEEKKESESEEDDMGFGLFD